jgi:hypothetical protein
MGKEALVLLQFHARVAPVDGEIWPRKYSSIWGEIKQRLCLGDAQRSRRENGADYFAWGGRSLPKTSSPVTRANLANVLNEGLRIREIGRRMNSKVRLVETGVYRK